MFSIPIVSDNEIMSLDARNLTLLDAKSKGADQPVHPRGQISAYVIRLLESKIFRLADLLNASIQYQFH